MNKCETALVELLKSALFGEKPNLPDDTDFTELLAEAEAQTVTSLCFSAVPKDKNEMWVKPVMQNTANYMRCLSEQSKLIKLLDEGGIPLVIIKGAAAAIYYKRPAERRMGDIDFLVSPKDFDKVQKILNDNGYEYLGNHGDGREYTYKKGSVVIEPHLRYSDSRLDIEDIIAKGLENVKIHELNGHRFPTLPDSINGLVIIDHIRHHIYSGLGLRQIIDYMMFLTYIEQGGGLEEFLDTVRSAGLFKFCKILTKMCVLFLGLPDKYPFCDDADGETAKQLFESILKCGNFGRKSPYVYRPMESLTKNVREIGLLKVLQDAGLTNWKAAKRHKFLRPFAFIYQAFRFIMRGFAALFRGENLKKDIVAGNETIDFQNRLGI